MTKIITICKDGTKIWREETSEDRLDEEIKDYLADQEPEKREERRFEENYGRT